LRLGRVEQILSSTGGSKGSFGESMELVIALGNWRVVLPFPRGDTHSWWTTVVIPYGGNCSDFFNPKALEQHK